MKLAKFKINFTPPEKTPVLWGTGDETTGIRDNLWFRGIILDDGVFKYVIASLDYCGLMNSAYDDLVETIAQALNLPLENVIIHCIHQHDAPLINFEIDEILGVKTFPRDWWNDLLVKTSERFKQALREMINVSGIGFASKKISGYASNRRIIGNDGKIKYTRYSKCNFPQVKAMPCGTIDPVLRTVAFKDEDDNIIASWNFYATHPQVADGRKMFSADAPGEAMKLIEKNLPEGFPCYFSGLSGNVTAGKYSTTDLEGNISKFGKILADGIESNLKCLNWTKCDTIKLTNESFIYPRKKNINYCFDDPAKNNVIEAVVQSCMQYAKNVEYKISMLSFGSVNILFFPGEPFVEYQLFAQSQIADDFLAVCGNCSDNFLYVPMKKSFAEGGYEVEKVCWCTEKIEDEMKTAIKNIVSKHSKD